MPNENMPQEGNPFLDIVNGSPLGGEQVEQGMTGEMPSEPGVPNEGDVGQTGDTTRPLVSAMAMIHRYIQSTTDRSAIGTARSILTLITGLIRDDQQSAIENRGVVPQPPAPQGKQGA